jgi:hypothetical protein
MEKTMDSRLLPEPFADLQRFVPEWGLATEQARFLKLHSVTLDQLRVFYDAMRPRMDQVLDHLDQYTIGVMPADAQVLYQLAMTFAETAHPLDLKWKDVDFPDAYPWQKFEFRTVSANG